MKFQKKPRVIEAMQFVGGHVSLRECDAFIGADARIDYGRATLAIQTLEGKMLVTPGDWIIRGVRGEFYPIKNEIFAATYEPVTDEPPTNKETDSK